MRQRISALVVMMTVLAGGMAHAQEPPVRVTASLEQSFLVTGQAGTLNVEVSVNGSSGGIPQPQILETPPGMTITPMPGITNQSFNMINGVTTISSTSRFTIRADQPGEYQVKGITVTYGGTQYTAPPITIPVVTPENANQFREKNPQLYSEILLDKTSVYVGEQVHLTLVMRQVQGIGAQALQLDGFDEAAFFKGFVKEKIDEGPPRSDVINGQSYRTDELLHFVLFPVSAGSMTLGPITLVAQVPDRRQTFFFNTGKNYSLPTNTVTLNVLPIPDESRPPEYNGAVGRYNLRAQVDREEVTVGDLVTLQVIVDGLGNITSVPDPILPDLSGFASFDPQTKRNKQIYPEGLGGTAEFSYVLSPKEVTSQEIGPVKFAFFDPQLKQFQIRQTSPLRLRVLPSAGPRGEDNTVAISAPIGMVVLSEEFRHIATDPALLNNDGSLPLRGSMPVLGMIPLAVIGATLVLRNRRTRRLKDPAYARRMDADKIAKKRLATARSLQASSDIKGFYAEIARVLVQYISDLLNRPAAGMTTVELRQILTERGCPDDLTGRVVSALEKSDAVRFGALVQVEDMQGSLTEVTELISMLRQSVANAGKGRK